MVGPYRVVERIGEGGMGVVDLGVATEGDLVAIKTLRAGALGGTDGRARFEREIAAMRRVRGSKVAEVLDADANADPPYVVTRYVRGMPLSKVVADHGPLRGDALHRFASGLAEALSSVHAAGIVHRDIKPANVLLTDDGPVLIDFGLAHAVGDARLTTVGVVAGTPGYLAPETAYGHDATFATDIHGWAATVTFAAAGSSPYGDGPDAVVLDRIRRGDHHVAELPEPLKAVVTQGLRVDPASRPSLADIGTALGVEETMAFVVPPEDVGGAGEPKTALVESPEYTSASTAETRMVKAPSTMAYQVDDESTEPHPVPPVAPRSRPWLSRLPVVAGGMTLIALGVVWPYFAMAALFATVLIGRVTWRVLWRLGERRTAGGGPRRSDRLVTALTAPLDVGLSVVPAAVEAALVVASGYIAGAGLNAVDLDIPGWSLVPFVTGGVVTLSLAWWGPGAAKFRYGVRTITAPLADAPRVTWSITGALVAGAWIFAILWDGWGTSWVPFGGPFNPFG